ncbi:SAM domain-containing protein SAMSN-1-like [Acipenser oxyrinchus oxyrinchus]|uniref:SAM domain-containing protein SAMSN-1-like n=1 Tax=Acipenser oxyrinchus oxyrinchus TaxID=40147 RepID=A0AAD8G5Z7_ACIOX|nr:SAM domain-containing protein SAMSN-1-like [Acipenser oxyrinchus oxyrinchus]
MLQRKSSNVSDKPKCQKPKRSSSFGRFDAFRHHSSAQPAPEDNSESSAAEGECEAEACDQSHNKPSSNTSISKKMRAISLTMRRKMGRKYSKAFSEEMGEDTEQDCGTHEGDHGHGQQAEKAPLKASDSMESLYSGRSSSSGVTSGSDGSSNRDSIRLEEDVPYCGPFCGSCRVHTDFIPSPYDSDSLKLKKGDVIEIISKPPMGTWTGMLHNKVGSFKFIYVDVIPQKEEVEQERKIRPHRRSRRPRPKTLLEMLERLDLKEYASSLLLNGYQTVEDLKDLKEKHLIELNVSDPEHRTRLLAAIENLAGIEYDNEKESEQLQVPQTLESNLRLESSHLNECPRDSGCYITSESSDNGREEPLPGLAAPSLQRNPLQCPDSTLHDLSGD